MPVTVGQILQLPDPQGRAAPCRRGWARPPGDLGHRGRGPRHRRLAVGRRDGALDHVRRQGRSRAAARVLPPGDDGRRRRALRQDHPLRREHARRHHRAGREAQVPHHRGAAGPSLDQAHAGRHRGDHQPAGLAARAVAGHPPQPAGRGHPGRGLAGTGRRGVAAAGEARLRRSTSPWRCWRPRPGLPLARPRPRRSACAARRSARAFAALGMAREAVPPRARRACRPCSPCPSWPATSGSAIVCAVTDAAEPLGHGDRWCSSTRPPSPRSRWRRTGCASRPRCG